MSTEETQHNNKEAQKTVVAFVVGLLVGGGLMWMFGGTPATPETDGTNPTAPANTETENATEEEPVDTPVDDATEQPTATDTARNGAAAVEEPAAMSGEGAVSVTDQAAGSEVVLESAVYPMSEGWIGVRDYDNGNLGALLGVVRFSESQELTPSAITLQRATEAGQTYAVVFYSDDGDREFSLATDAMVGGVQATFTAQ